VSSTLGGAVPGTSIILDGRVATVTHGDGSFELARVGIGAHLVEVRRIGFVPSVFEIDVPADDLALELPVTMQPVPVELEMIVVDAERTIWVTGRMREFYDRRRSSRGHFFMSSEIEKRGPIQISDLLRELPGVRVMPGIGGARVGMLRGSSGPVFSSTGAGGCAPRVFLDGMRVTVDDDFPLDNLVDPNWIGGLEVYTSAVSAPIRYGAASSCGVILIWTK